MRVLSRLALITILAAIGCRGEKRAAPAAEPVASARPDSTTDPRAAGPPKDAAAAAAASAPRPTTPEEVASQRRYLAALARGRRETAAKRWGPAITAFDAAIAENPADARAHAERGYARLREGVDREGARNDLRAAASLTTDPKLSAQIWFNRGLLDESEGRAEAVFDFWTSNRLAPTQAAQAKLGRGPVCPIRTLPRVDAATSAAFEAASWLDLYRALLKGGLTSHDEDASSEVDAIRRLTGKPIAGDVEIATIGVDGRGRGAFVVVARGGKLRATLVGSESGGRCPGTVDFEVVAREGDLVHVHGREIVEGGYSYMCFPPDGGESRPCRDGDFDVPGMTSQSFCAGGTPTERDVLIDRRSGGARVIERPVLDGVEGDASLPRIVATVEGRALRVRGLDCDRLEPIDVDGGK